MAKLNKNQNRAVAKLRIAGPVIMLSALIWFAWIARNTSGFLAEPERANKASLTLLPSCRRVLAPLSGDQPIDAEISRLQQQALNPNKRGASVERLGWTFVKKARSTFDAGFYKLADECAACMEANGSNAADALLLHAHALQSLHRFTDAEIAARQLVQTRERPFDYGVLGDVLIDEGKIHEGAAAYQKMVDLRPDLQSYARAAHVRWLTGDLDGAIKFMQLAVTSSSPNDAESGAWAFTRLAIYQLQRAATKQALDSCDAALNLLRDYAPALLARGRILLALNRPVDAVADLQSAAKLNPLPEYLWALADALSAAGYRDAAKHVESQIIERGASEDPRSLSVYLATRRDDVDRAVQLAEQELRNRQDIFTHDALAWALVAAGRPGEAKVHAQHALAEGTRDARLYFHAGVIAVLDGDIAKGGRYLQQANAMRQMLFPSEQDQLVVWQTKISEPRNSNNGK